MISPPPTAGPSIETRIPSPIEPRLNVAIRLEMMLLILRYVMYMLLVLNHAMGFAEEYTPSLVGITIGFVIQNAWAHFIFYTRRYHWLVHPANFLMYLGKVTLLVSLTGAGSSPLAPLYIALIVGYCMCSTQLTGTYRVTVICAGTYALVVLVSWGLGAYQLGHPVSFNFFLIFLCGWMLNSMGEMLRSVELDGQRRAQALASSEGTLRAILNSTASPIIVCQENELISDVNEGACEFIGLPREELVGRRIRAYLFDDGTLPQKLATLRSKGAYHGEAIVLTADGDERMVDLRVRSYTHDQQRSFVIMLHDITTAKNLQEAARMTTQRLEQVNRELQQVNQLRTEFYTTIARRLRSPLSGILGFLDMVLDGELGELNAEQRRALQSCRRSVMRVFGLADEVLDAVAQFPPASQSEALRDATPMGAPPLGSHPNN